MCCNRSRFSAVYGSSADCDTQMAEKIRSYPTFIFFHAFLGNRSRIHIFYRCGYYMPVVYCESESLDFLFYRLEICVRNIEQSVCYCSCSGLVNRDYSQLFSEYERPESAHASVQDESAGYGHTDTGVFLSCRKVLRLSYKISPPAGFYFKRR